MQIEEIAEALNEAEVIMHDIKSGKQVKIEDKYIKMAEEKVKKYKKYSINGFLIHKDNLIPIEMRQDRWIIGGGSDGEPYIAITRPATFVGVSVRIKVGDYNIRQVELVYALERAHSQCDCTCES
ncbi:MAG: hypothetical protein JZD41_05575 [Thermoproteus sp.]|nr:hypothetical protein [Thermoproteus sp.]